MKIMLNGFVQETNFGDVLFAHLFYRKCRELGFESVDFWQTKKYGVGESVRKELGYSTKKSMLSCLFADAYILISGGSLGENVSNRQTVRMRYLRFVLPARLYELMGKPVYILGVGGGPVENKWLRKRMVRMLDGATVIQFRDEETRAYFEQYGVKNKMVVTSDTAQVITREMLPELAVKRELDAFAAGRKKLFLHLSENDKVNEQILAQELPGVIRFLDEHPEYVLVTGFDNVRVADPAERLRNLPAVKALQARGDVFLYNYTESWQLCALLAEMDCIITQKLHVGVLGATLGRSVVSFPVHREKTQRYYRQIGEAGRSVHMSEVTPDVVFAQLEKYHDHPITLPAHIRREAEKNLAVIGDLLKE